MSEDQGSGATWNCPVCTQANAARSMVCKRCGCPGKASADELHERRLAYQAAPVADAADGAAGGPLATSSPAATISGADHSQTPDDLPAAEVKAAGLLTDHTWVGLLLLALLLWVCFRLFLYACVSLFSGHWTGMLAVFIGVLGLRLTWNLLRLSRRLLPLAWWFIGLVSVPLVLFTLVVLPALLEFPSMQNLLPGADAMVQALILLLLVPCCALIYAYWLKRHGRLH